MSSDYRVICVSHDPAIVIDHDWHSSRGGREQAVTAAADPQAHQELADHVNCDLLVGRYSYPLVEVCCPPNGRRPTDLRRHSHYPFHPGGGEWIEAQWLRLLLAAREATGPTLEAARQIAGCWNAARLHSLRFELGAERNGVDHG